jgi:hypothetical protein
MADRSRVARNGGLVWYLKPEIWKMEGAGEGGTIYGLLTGWYRL